jgi:hypothetical protein
MAPFDNSYSSNLTNKLSPLIEGQVPDFVQSDHPLFVKFLKYYYEYLEAGELRVTVNIDNLLLELETKSHVLDVDGNQIVLEDGTLITGETVGTDGKFVVNETITGSTSKATAKVLVDDLGNATNPRMFITSQQQFQTGETITGGTSGATGTVDRYRANPVQTIQQLLEYANVDNTIYDFLDQLRESFMNAIPNNLATGVDKRNLIKNIRELYRAKGTSEGHKIFMRMLLGETSEVIYPNKFMMRTSDGNWVNQVILRCSPSANAIPTELIGVLITGQTSGATAVVSNALSTAEGGAAIVQFELNPDSIVGTFTDGESITGTSRVQDVTMTFTIRGMVTNLNVSGGGILYDVGDDLELDTQSAIGNAEAKAKVGSIKRGSVSEVIIDDAGTKYDVGDVLTFTTTESSTNTKDATGFVSVIDGSIILDGTDSSTTNAGDTLILEGRTTSQLEDFQIVLDGGGTEASAVVNGETTESATVTLDGNSGTIVVGMTISGEDISRSSGITVTAVSTQNSITISSTLTLADDINLFFDNTADGIGDTLVLNGIDSSSTHAGSNILLSPNGYDLPLSLDTYGTETDSFALEEGTVATGEITKIFISDGGGGYSLLPTATVASTGGTGAALLATTTTIGAVDSADIANQGFEYTQAPESQFHANFVLKDVTGTFATTNTLTTHTGTVKNYNATTKVLETTFEDVVRFVLETGNLENFALESGTAVDTDRFEGSLLAENVIETDDQLVDESGNNLVLDTSFPGKQLDYFFLEEGTDDGKDGFLVEEDVRIGIFLHEGLDHSAIALESAPGRNGGSVDPTNGRAFYDKLLSEQDGDLLIFETEGLSTERYFETGSHSRNRFVTEESAVTAILDDAGDSLITNGDTFHDANDVEIFLVLDGTDSSSTNAGDRITNESETHNNNLTLDGSAVAEVTVNGAVTSSDQITVDGVSGTIAVGMHVTVKSGATSIADSASSTAISTNDVLRVTVVASQTSFTVSERITVANDVVFSLQTDAGGKLVHDIETADGNIAINGTDSNSADAGDNIVNQDLIDFTTSPVTITDSGGATATIASANIAKGTTTVGTQTETVPSYGSNTESLIGESLNRLQDSVFYQQFSYQIETASSSSDYITQLKKAVHPAGFNIFGKVSIATLISTAIGTTGSSLGGGYTADTDSFSPILASTFVALFDEKLQFRMGISEGFGVNNFDDEILLETDETNIGEMILNGTDSSSTNAGYRLVSETLSLNFPDFEGISISYGTAAGEFGVLVDETDSDRIIAESAEATQTSLLIDSTPDSDHITPSDAGSNFLLNGTDSSSTDAGDSIELEQSLCDKTTFFTFDLDTVNNNDNLLNEDGGNQYLETAGKGNQGAVGDGVAETHERSIISLISRKVYLPNVQASPLSTGLVILGQNSFVGHTDGGGIELEFGTAISGVLTLNGFEQINVKGSVDTVIAAGEEFQLEDFSDQNYDSGFTFEQLAKYTYDDIVLNGTDGSSTNAGDNLLLDAYDGTGRFAGDLIQGESVFNYNYFVLEDIIRQDRFIIDPFGGGELFGILQETDEIGSFKQEDGTTVTGTHGDDMLLEDETGVGRQNKISLEFQRIAPEDEVLKRSTYGFDNIGTIPIENFTNSDIEPFTYPSDIESRLVGSMRLESSLFEVTNIQLESGTAGGAFGNLVLDSSAETSAGATDENAPIPLEESESIFRNTAFDNIVLNGIDSSSTNAGSNIREEAGSFIDQLSNASIVQDTTIEGGFDSNQTRFDESDKRFDSSL